MAVAEAANAYSLLDGVLTCLKATFCFDRAIRQAYNGNVLPHSWGLLSSWARTVCHWSSEEMILS
jgi:hypothetical protein